MSDEQKPLPRSPTGDETWSRSTVLLFERQIAFLDKFIADIEEKTQHKVSRAEVVRALIDALIWSDADTTLIGALYGRQAHEVEAEVTSPYGQGNPAADLLRDVLVEMLAE